MVYSTYLIHPTLVKSVVVSIESQSAWTLLTWCIWVGCTATLNRAVPLVALKSHCAGADYCTQLRSAFGTCSPQVDWSLADACRSLSPYRSVRTLSKAIHPWKLTLASRLILTIGMLRMSWMTWRIYRLSSTRTQARY